MFRYLHILLAACMNIIKVEDVCRKQTSHQLFPKQMLFVFQTLPDTVHRLLAHLKIMGRKFHNRILQKRQIPDNTVITADGNRGNERIRKVHQNTLKIFGIRKLRHECSIGQNHIISCRDVIAGILKRETHISSAAKNMDYSSCIS